ncbi:MAG: AMP-binding protein [Bacteroidota bacterium]|nr:AMP-binding protein [Bacteroidota bacterium]
MTGVTTPPSPLQDAPACPWAEQARIRPDSIAFVDADRRCYTWRELDDWIRAREAWIASTNGPILHVPDRRVSDVALLAASMRAGRDIVLVGSRMPEPQVADILRRLGAVRSTEADITPGSTAGPSTSLPMLSGATRLLTSGSTGNPRWIRHTARPHLSSAYSVIDALDLGPDDRWAWSLPMQHVGGLSILWRCAVAGAAVVSPPATEDGTRWIVSENPNAPTHASLVPTQLRDVLSRGVRPTHLKEVILGGASIAFELLQHAAKQGWPVRTSYGMTETASIVCLSARWTAEDVNRATHPWTNAPTVHAGQPLPHAEVEIDDSRIMVQSESLADGVADVDGWYATQDAGVLDDQGRLVVNGRLDRVIISGGENIDPSLIEQALLRIPDIATATVIGVPDARWGERPVAFVTMVSEDRPNQEAIRAALAESLESFALPDHILLHPEPQEGQLKVTLAELIRLARAAEDEDSTN